jgi:hypothetical protein
MAGVQEIEVAMVPRIQQRAAAANAGCGTHSAMREPPASMPHSRPFLAAAPGDEAFSACDYVQHLLQCPTSHCPH